MRLFTDDGDTVPVTVVDVSNNRVTQVKTEVNDGYSALQVAFGSRKASRVTKPAAGHLAKAGVEAGEVIKEFRVTADVAGKYAAGAVVPAAGGDGDRHAGAEHRRAAGVWPGRRAFVRPCAAAARHSFLLCAGASERAAHAGGLRAGDADDGGVSAGE